MESRVEWAGKDKFTLLAVMTNRCYQLISGGGRGKRNFLRKTSNSFEKNQSNFWLDYLTTFSVVIAAVGHRLIS